MKKFTFKIVLLAISLQAIAIVNKDYNLTQEELNAQQEFYNNKQDTLNAILNKISDNIKKSEVFHKEDSYGNPIINETPGLPDWAERDVIALKTEIQKTIERIEVCKQTNASVEVVNEIEYVLGNS